MSFDLDASIYLPTTPPELAVMHQYVGDTHARSTSGSSAYSHDSSPKSAVTCMTTPSVSPPHHQHGPQLLPKIRTQDVVVEPVSAPGPTRHRRVVSNTRNPPGYAPYPTNRPASLQRNLVDTVDCSALISPISTANASGLSSPITLTTSTKRKSIGHSRSGSTSSIDEATLSRYGYPTYRQLPRYISQSQGRSHTSISPISPVTPSSFIYPTHSRAASASGSIPHIQVPLATPAAPPPTIPSPQYNNLLCVPQGPPSPVIFNTQPPASPSSTTLLSYLTGPTQAINLVRNVNIIPTRGLHDYFWWDIRNLRSWFSFSPSTFNSIHGLTQLLKTPIPSQLTPLSVVAPSRLAPDSELALINLINDIYAPRVNAALAVSQGHEHHLQLYPAPDLNTSTNKNNGGAHFLANYATDTERTSSGGPRGRVVGIVKSFDRWNTGMRNEPPHRRVEYLKGLAHLQRCMREHSCRYGFIMTEIELVCVRAGCDDGDDVPYFGFLELAVPIATKDSALNFQACGNLSTLDQSETISHDSSRESSRSASPPGIYEPLMVDGLDIPMTASLGLYFLLMLSKAVPLPSQPSGHLNVGGPGTLTRQRVLPEGKDKWIPEPQVGERRDAKRVRGWIWPQDAWHRREGGMSRQRSGSKAKK